MTPQEYLANHSLKEDFVLARGWEWSDDVITIPIFDTEGKFLFNKYRQLKGDAKFTADSGSHPTLYCAEHIKKLSWVVLCEGEPDCIRLWQEGIPAVTGTFGVATFSDKLAEPLRGKTVYICLDTDEAGQKGIAKYVEVLTKVNATPLILSLPNEYKDVSEYFTAGHTKEEFKGLKAGSISPEEYLLREFSQQYPILDNQTFHNTEYPPTKWLIDKLIRVGGISFLVGESGTGKTIASLSIAKAISEGSLWLDKFQALKQKVLIIDKENTPSDIQRHYQTMGIKNDNIYSFFTENDYQLVSDKGEPTEIANYFSLFIKANDIGVVILDSAIDFLIGDENSSGDVATNINLWRSIFAPASILTIHHDGKQDPRNRKKAADRMRGSSVWLSSAQSVLSFSVLSPTNPKDLMVEHAKVRGGRKQKPFQIEMIIRDDPFKEGETIVDGYKFIKEINPISLKVDEAQKEIIKFLSDNIGQAFTTKELEENLKSVIDNPRNVSSALYKLLESKDIERSGGGKKNDPYVFKMCVSNMLENVIKNVDN